jgi:protein-tyrosine phosphatase
MLCADHNNLPLSGCPPFVDFHAHILPAADHGSPDLNHSLRQLECARAAGVRRIVATPHYYISDDISVPDFIGKRTDALNTLLESKPAGIEIIPAAEVHLTFETPELEYLPLLCVGNTNYILIEMPFGTWNSWVFDALLAVSAERNLKPVIAHVDRYDINDLQKLLPFGFTLQVNAESVCRYIIRKRFMPYIESGDITLLGSDVHDLPERSYKAYSRAIGFLGDKTISMMKRADIILSGEPL